MAGLGFSLKYDGQNFHDIRAFFVIYKGTKNLAKAMFYPCGLRHIDGHGMFLTYLCPVSFHLQYFEGNNVRMKMDGGRTNLSGRLVVGKSKQCNVVDCMHSDSVHNPCFSLPLLLEAVRRIYNRSGVRK